MRGVELHRQRHQLEHRGQGEQQNAHQEQGLAVQEHAHQQQNEGEFAPQLCDGDDGLPQPHRAVAHSVLDSVPRLMAGHAHRRDGGGSVHVLGQVDGVVPGIVVVRQAAPAGPDAHVIDAVGAEDRLRRLGAGETPAAALGAVAPEIAADLELGPQGQQHHRDQQDAVDVVGQEITVAVIIRHDKTSLDAFVGLRPNLPGRCPGPAAFEKDRRNFDLRAGWGGPAGRRRLSFSCRLGPEAL